MDRILKSDGDEMTKRKCFRITLLCALFFLPEPLAAGAISIEGAPNDTGYNVGSVATIRVTLRGVSSEVSRYVVFAEIQFVGTTAVTSVQMDRQVESPGGEIRYEAGWPIPPDAPTGLYSVTIRVEDRSTRKVVATQRLPGFAAYRKLVRIARLSLDKTFYSPGEPILCEVALENLTEHEIKDLRVEFSNANYPWIALFSTEDTAGGREVENPDLALRVLRDHLNLPARGAVTLPMMPAGRGTFLQGAQQTVLGAGPPARHEKVPPPEVNKYTLAVWNSDRTVLYDMQFSPQAIIRAPDRVTPKPYSTNFTHPYNADIDFVRYRQFYAPGDLPPAIIVNRARTLFRPGDRVKVKAALKNSGEEAWKGAELRAEFMGTAGKQLHTATLLSGFTLATGQTHQVGADAWTVPTSLAPGTYFMKLSLLAPGGKPLAKSTAEIAVNALPASLLVFGAHEDDELSYAGLIRAAVEAGVPVRVVIFTAGDVGQCERYYSKPCGPNEAREFGLVRMEETAEALEHLGLPRDRLTFLGLPDGGSGAIWSHHINVSNPFLSIYLASDHAPYGNVLKPNLPYARDAVIELVKQVLLEFRPAMIATAHPDERHVDHRVANWFVMKACHGLLRENRMDLKTIFLVDQAYGAGGAKPAPFQYEKAPVYLSGEAAALKQEIHWIYQSQDGNLEEGMRRPFAELPREEMHYRIADWQEHAGWNE